MPAHLALSPAARARFERADYDAAYAAGAMTKAGGDATPVFALSGRLILSSTGWILLEVPNAVARGFFDALAEPGVELPLKDGKLRAHISVVTVDEMAKLGLKTLQECGAPFSYQLGKVKTVVPSGWKEMSRVWFLEVASPALSTLRKTYGLSPLPGGDRPFHITIAVRRRGVLHANEISKAASGDPHPSRNGEDANPQQLAGNVRALRESEPQAVQGLRGTGDRGLPKVARELRGVFCGHGGSSGGDVDRSAQQCGGLQPNQLLLVAPERAGQKQAKQPSTDLRWPYVPGRGMGRGDGDFVDRDPREDRRLQLVDRGCADDPGGDGAKASAARHMEERDARLEVLVGESGSLLRHATHPTPQGLVGRSRILDTVPAGPGQTHTKASGDSRDKLAASTCDGCEKGCRGCKPGEYCPNPDCDGRLERGDDGDCNRCGGPWPGGRMDKSIAGNRKSSSAAPFSAIASGAGSSQSFAPLAVAGGVLAGLGTVGAYGAYNAPSGHRLEGGVRSLSRFRDDASATGTGGLVGAGLGAAAGSALGGTENATLVGAGLGGVAGAVGGGLLGDKYWRLGHGIPSWTRPRPRVAEDLADQTVAAE